MISEIDKRNINILVTSSISINNGLVIPNPDFDNQIQKIKDLKLKKNIPSDEVHEFLKEILEQLKCSDYYVKEFFRWTAL